MCTCLIVQRGFGTETCTYRRMIKCHALTEQDQRDALALHLSSRQREEKPDDVSVFSVHLAADLLSSMTPSFSLPNHRRPRLGSRADMCHLARPSLVHNDALLLLFPASSQVFLPPCCQLEYLWWTESLCHCEMTHWFPPVVQPGHIYTAKPSLDSLFLVYQSPRDVFFICVRHHNLLNT